MIDYQPTPMEFMFLQTLALISVACIVTPLFKKSGLGSVLGYLTAGVIVNLLFFGEFSDHPQELLHFSEFGVVLFLFIIGLELKPQTLWQMRGDIFGLGLAQMAACGLLLGIAAWLYGYALSPAIIIGLGLALSSTAMVMQQLDERRERTTPHGRKAFGILLFQDLAIVPLLLLAALLAPVGDELTFSDSARQVGIAVAAIALLIFSGRFLLDRLFARLARSHMPEIMTASALGVVIAAAMLMDVAGMSYAMGSFLAGVMLAESSYRHEIEANIEPFRGLFLGLFFMAVGLSLDLNVITANWLIILLATPIAMLLKGLAIYAATRMLRNDHNTSVRIALGLVQHGEFGFVLFSAAAATGLLAGDTASTLIPIIAASMALSPLTSKLEHFLVRTAPRPTPNEDYSDANGSVIIIGFGRFGQVVSQPLFAAGNQITILDNDPVRIEDARRFGFRVHYGDGRRRDILRVTGVKDAQAVIICTDKPDVTSEIVQMVQNGNSDVLVYARSFDRLHSIRLYEQRATYTVRETFESALMLSRHALAGLGKDDELVTDIITNIRHRDLKRLRQQAREGVLAGRDQLHVQPVQPEPLSP